MSEKTRPGIHLFTIGFTQKTAEEFFGLLQRNHVQILVDIRLKPDSQLSGFAKGRDLPYFLQNLIGCDYAYMPLMTPAEDILQQYRQDSSWEHYEIAFNRLLLERDLIAHLDREWWRTHRACLLCSEHEPDHCHRRLVAEYMAAHWPEVEIHLILTRAGEKTLFLETGKLAADVRNLADCTYSIDDIGCRLASGSFPTHGMVVAACSIHTMSAIAAGITSNLLTRAADVTLKERRRLILMVRETPLHLGHLRTMAALAEMGAIIAPPAPAFYNQPQTLLDVVDHSVDRVLDLLGLPDPDAKRWDGARAKP